MSFSPLPPLENAMFLQLLYEGYSVHIGKIYQKVTDFVTVKDGRVVYVQVTDEMLSESTRERAGSSKSITDNYEKIVVVQQGTYERDGGFDDREYRQAD